MKIAVFSDSHRHSGWMIDHVLISKPDAVIFLGDILEDTLDFRSVFPGLPLYRVAGNCDFSYDDVLELELGGYRFLLCHGHQFRVKAGLERLHAEGARRRVDAVLFGHTHRQHAEIYDGILYLNPGSASGFGGYCCAEITTGEKGLTYELIRA